MAIEFKCPYCEKLLRTTDDRGGQMAKCPDCNASVTVPVSAGRSSLPSESAFAPTQVPTAGLKPCPKCGEQIQQAAVKCRFCGEEFGSREPTSQMTGRNRLPEHRGGLILAFGLLGWLFCALFAPVAWVMGNSDLAEMDAGTMDPEGRSLTQVGRILGMVQCILFIIGIVFALGFIAIAMIAG